ncbi:hypothetical protein [Kosakonia sp. YIM B13611]|uniref:hypothetical protein n=1 Tax=unclassified Kosakonia TaxID=2632876 RepID=UPI0036972B7A
MAGTTEQEQQSNNITLPDILEAVQDYLADNLEDFETPEAFVTKELPLKLLQLHDLFNRYLELGVEQAAKGRKGFERNRHTG